MIHGLPCNAYNFVLKGQRRIDRKKLKKTKLPNSPLLGRLKQGKDIVFNGKRYKAKDLTYMEQGKKVSFILDTALNSKMRGFAKNSDLLVIESTFSATEEKLAREHKHLTVKHSATTAKNAKARKLALIHISDRYEKDFSEILKDAQKIFRDAFIPKDLDVVNI